MYRMGNIYSDCKPGISPSSKDPQYAYNVIEKSMISITTVVFVSVFVAILGMALINENHSSRVGYAMMIFALVAPLITVSVCYYFISYHNRELACTHQNLEETIFVLRGTVCKK